MSDTSRSRGLEVIFAFFLGLLITVFIGVGMYTFYPYPNTYSERISDLWDAERDVRNFRPQDQLTEEERKAIREITEERERLTELANSERDQWTRTTSALLIALATLVMTISMSVAQALPVLNNGLLLGGLFTLVYGVGWIMTADNSVARFLAVTIALLTTLILGYIRFVRRRSVDAVSMTPKTAPIGKQPQGLAELEKRLSALEARIDGVARVLNQGIDPKRRN